MGRKSIRSNKNIYQKMREQAGLTRQQAEDLMQFVNAERIEKIESEKTVARPEEILQMSKCYRRSDLINYYCSHQCPIGQRYIPYLKTQPISETTLQLLASLNRLNSQKDQLLAIMEDSNISQDELQRFSSISKDLDDLCKQAQSLKIWLEQQKLHRD